MLNRFLLSHNYSITEDIAPPLSREKFCQGFKNNLPNNWEVNQIDHPHWICEIKTKETPEIVSNMLVKVLVNFREIELGEKLPYRVLALGGIKNTPANTSSPNSLDFGDWGVDVVETLSPEEFLKSINWDTLISGRSEHEIFKVLSV
ncbi:DUF2656 family protein [Geminocystis sp. NIES-3709]|uniref:DUF2656 family protein n=1 Tax=Geminocystis sp. NIES-3709 TaxID=1617448 RepID=UPI0005FC9BA0|nr:DUF2656 family protein [Geminocystis sp. NIES-3709]BAQ65922.1 hypothetical protein GM3709_2687 [Geminocystis sp. NIES-3709]